MEIDAKDAHDVHFFEKLLKRLPCDTQILEILAGLCARYGMDQQALSIDRKLVRLSPGDPRARYNLACSLSLSGKTREAIAVLREAIKLGYSDARWLEKDRNLKGTSRAPRVHRSNRIN